MLVRYSFPGKRLVDAIVDLPLPSRRGGGYCLTFTICEERVDWAVSRTVGIQVAFTPLGVITAHLYWFAFCRAHRAARLGRPECRAGRSGGESGATRWQTFTRVLLPTVFPALLTDLRCLARALGEAWLGLCYFREHADAH